MQVVSVDRKEEYSKRTATITLNSSDLCYLNNAMYHYQKSSHEGVKQLWQDIKRLKYLVEYGKLIDSDEKAEAALQKEAPDEE